VASIFLRLLKYYLVPIFCPFSGSILLLVLDIVFVYISNIFLVNLVFILGLFFRLLIVLDIQVGCPLRCSFCATGKGGFSRNLKRHEIVEQVLLMSSYIHSS
jgi:hypothetical protein